MVYFHGSLLKNNRISNGRYPVKQGAMGTSTEPLLSIALQKVGIIRTFPRVIVYTSKRYQGLRVKHLWYNQQLKYQQI